MKIIYVIKKRMLLFSVIGMYLLISCISISYASLNTSMLITGHAYVRVEEEIRVTDIKMLSLENGAYETYNGKYTKNTTNMYMTLPNIDSRITYQITIENKSDNIYTISEITDELVNKDITYIVENYDSVKLIPQKSTVLLNISFYYQGSTLPTDITQIATINYKFSRPYAKQLKFNNANISTECTDVQCALDELYNRF